MRIKTSNNRKWRRKQAAIAKIAAKRQKRLVKLGGLNLAQLIGDEWESIAIGVLISYLRVRQPMKSIGEYGLVSRRTAKTKFIEGNDICWDATSGLILTCNDIAVACIAYEVVGNIAVVHQIQGRKGKEEYLRVFQWESMLLQVIVALMTEAGLKRVDVRAAENNRYYSNKRHTQFIRLYDETARKLGFSEPSNGRVNFHLQL